MTLCPGLRALLKCQRNYHVIAYIHLNFGLDVEYREGNKHQSQTSLSHSRSTMIIKSIEGRITGIYYRAGI